MIDTIVLSINRLINEAVSHGGDSGGAYLQNATKLYEAIQSLLNNLHLNQEYEPIFLSREKLEEDEISKLFSSAYWRTSWLWTDIIVVPKNRDLLESSDDFELIF